MKGASPPRFLASDLDGTLIPGPRERDPEGAGRFREWRARHPDVYLAYLTGRHLELALDGVTEHELPLPDFLGCDVGTSMYRREGTSWSLETEYRDRMRMSWSGFGEVDVLEALHGLPGVTPQGADRNSEFKISFFASPVDDITELAHQARVALAEADIEAGLIASVDPTGRVGLIDVLPPDASKLSALTYLQEVLDLEAEHTVFAGDSGNDEEALLHGGPAILVGNAPEALKALVRDLAQSPGGDDLYLAEEPNVAGVLEGLARLGLA